MSRRRRCSHGAVAVGTHHRHRRRRNRSDFHPSMLLTPGEVSSPRPSTLLPIIPNLLPPLCPPLFFSQGFFFLNDVFDFFLLLLHQHTTHAGCVRFVAHYMSEGQNDAFGA